MHFKQKNPKELKQMFRHNKDSILVSDRFYSGQKNS